MTMMASALLKYIDDFYDNNNGKPTMIIRLAEVTSLLAWVWLCQNKYYTIISI